jgi:hypothetical protein
MSAKKFHCCDIFFLYQSYVVPLKFIYKMRTIEYIQSQFFKFIVPLWLTIFLHIYIYIYILIYIYIFSPCDELKHFFNLFLANSSQLSSHYLLFFVSYLFIYLFCVCGTGV